MEIRELVHLLFKINLNPSNPFAMRVQYIVFTLLVAFICACTARKIGIGDTRTKSVELLDINTYQLTEQTLDPTYGFTKDNPVKVGKEEGGPSDQRRFLNALLGPNGERVSYYRAGSCCPFKTPNGLFGDQGLLDLYKVSWQGSKDTLDIYINMYDKGDLYIPVGFTAKRNE